MPLDVSQPSTPFFILRVEEVDCGESSKVIVLSGKKRFTFLFLLEKRVDSGGRKPFLLFVCQLCAEAVRRTSIAWTDIDRVAENQGLFTAIHSHCRGLARVHALHTARYNERCLLMAKYSVPSPFDSSSGSPPPLSTGPRPSLSRLLLWGSLVLAFRPSPTSPA